MNILGEWPHQSDTVHIRGSSLSKLQRQGDCFIGQRSGGWPARDLLLLNGAHQFPVLQNGAGGLAENPAESENDHLDFFSIFAQVSRRATVRLKTRFCGVVSGSTEK